MNRFDVCVERLLDHEGGFVNHPRDPGKATNRGITIAVARKVYGEDFSVEDLRELTKLEAIAIYEARYWLRAKCDKLPIGLDYCHFDAAVNSGKGQAARWLQRVVGVADDGSVGPITLAAVGNLKHVGLAIPAYCAKRMDFLRRLSTWDDFGDGWTSRVTRVQKVSVGEVKLDERASFGLAKAPQVWGVPAALEPRPTYLITLMSDGSYVAAGLDAMHA